MTDYEANKVSSFQETEEVMIRNEDIWKESENATTQFGAIRLKMPLLTEYDQAQNKGPFVSVTLKKGLKNDLLDISMKVSDSAVDYAAGIKDRSLELQVTFTKNKLKKLRQIPLYDTLSKFYDLVSPLKSNFKHLEATDMDTFKSLLAEYKKAIPSTEADSDSSKTATQNIGETITELNGMFDELDKFIKPFSHKHKDFFSDYSNSRIYKDIKGRGKSKKKSKTDTAKAE